MNYLSALLGIALAGAITTAAIFRGNAAEWKDKYDSLQANYATAAASAITHAQAITAKDTKAIQNQGTNAVASAATKTAAIQVHYKTIYLPSLTKLDPKDEASKCANLPVPDSVLTSLPNGPGG